MGDDLLEQLQRALGDTIAIERELGGGGMSRVFAAVDRGLGRRIALKVVAPELAEGVNAERFRREIQVCASLQHPHIVPLLNTGTAGRLLYYVMPLVEGESLRERIAREGGLPLDDCVRLLGDVADALAYAHARGIVHRDIKPDNVLVADRHAQVTDFGIARALAADAQTAPLTTAGLLVGTPAYMAPEQADGGGQVDHRADIYSFGILAFEMLTGEPPFHAPTLSAMLAAHINRTPPAIAELRPTIPPELAELVMQCLQKHPADRPQSATSIREALEQVPLGRTSTTRTGVPARPAPGPKARTGRWWIGAGIVAAAVGGGLLWSVVRPKATASRADALVAGAPPPEASGLALRAGVAILPFDNMSPKADDEYLSDGITEELISAAANIQGLRVVSRTSAFALKKSGLEVTDIGRRLRVTAVLEGSVRRAGKRLRVTARLSKASDGFPIWSEVYDRDMADLFKVEEGIARAIAAALELRLAEGADQRLTQVPTRQMEAHDLYLRGRYLWNQRTPASLRAGLALFEQATRLDSAYALAFAGIADSYTILATHALVPMEEAYPRAKAAGLRALALDSTLVEARTNLADIRFSYDWDWAAAEQDFKRAVALNAKYPTAHYYYGLYLAAMGRFEESYAQFRLALELDPLSLPIQSNLGRVYAYARRFDAAVAQGQRVVAEDSTFGVGYAGLGLGYELIGELAKAREAFDHDARLRPTHPLVQASLARIDARLHRDAEARRLLADLVRRAEHEPVGPYHVGTIYAALGEPDQAFVWLQRAFRERSDWLPFLAVDPWYDPIRTDPRFDAMLHRLRLK